MRIGLITTLNHNIGDDFIRTGICHVLRNIFVGEEIEFVSINKHKPHTVYPAWHPVQTVRLAKFLPRGNRFAVDFIQWLLATSTPSRFEDCDAIVQCGAPVLWPGCHKCEWAVPLWHRVVRRLAERIPVLNIAAGSCYPWQRQPATIDDPADAAFLRAIHGYCRLTTVRDPLSHKLFDSLGCETPEIPCSALLASGTQQADRSGESEILINYMPGGGHYAFGQQIDPDTWRNTMKAVIERLRARHKVAFLCHSESEAKEAAALVTDIPRYLPQSIPEYFRIASRAKAGIFNRMHASVGLGGMGIPSVAICTDTRLLMVKNVGLPCYYVEDTSAAQLEDDVETLLSRSDQERDRLLELREQTNRRYTEKMSEALGRSSIAFVAKSATVGV